MKFDPKMLRLYAVTDRAWVGRQSLLEQIEDALRGGVTLVQLREKALSKEEFVEEAKAVLALCRRCGVPLIINDRLDVALESGADGVHVGIEDAPVAEIRRQAGPDFLIGATAKTVEQAQAEDGVVEAVRRRNSRFIWAVQWHPEFSFWTDDSSRRLFRAFVDHC